MFSFLETGLSYVVQNVLNLSIEWVGMAGMNHHDWLLGVAIPGDTKTSVLKLVLKSYQPRNLLSADHGFQVQTSPRTALECVPE